MFPVFDGDERVVSCKFQSLALLNENAGPVMVDLNRHPVDRSEGRGNDVSSVRESQCLMAKANPENRHGQLTIQRQVRSRHREQCILGSSGAGAEDEVTWLQFFQQLMKRYGVQPLFACR